MKKEKYFVKEIKRKKPRKEEPRNHPEPVVIVAIWRINREVVHGQSAVSGQAAPMLHVFSSYRQRTC
jgi:hypothetical protein